MSKKSEDIHKMRCMVRELAKIHGVDPKSVSMTTVPFFNFMAFILAKYPKESICSIGTKAGKCWKKLTLEQKKPYCVIARIVSRTGKRK